MQIKDLFTRQRHNEGVTVDIKNEAGTLIGWVRVRGLDSDAYRAAHDGYNQAMVRLATVVRAKDAGAPLLAATQAEKDEAKLAERAALVADWAGIKDDGGAVLPYSAENALRVIRESPSFGDEVLNIAFDRDRFLETASPASSAGQNINSASEDQQLQDQPEPSPNP